MVLVVWKKQILGIAIRRINKTFLVRKDKQDAQFDIIVKSFRQRSACVAVHLPLLYKK